MNSSQSRRRIAVASVEARRSSGISSRPSRPPLKHRAPASLAGTAIQSASPTASVANATQNATSITALVTRSRPDSSLVEVIAS